MSRQITGRETLQSFRYSGRINLGGREEKNGIRFGLQKYRVHRQAGWLRLANRYWQTLWHWIEALRLLKYGSPDEQMRDRWCGRLMLQEISCALWWRTLTWRWRFSLDPNVHKS